MVGRKRARLLLFAGSALLAACGGGGGAGSGSSAPPVSAFSLSSSSITFNAAQGGPTPSAQIIDLTANSGVFVGTGTIAITTSQNGDSFFHSFVITGTTTGQITVTPAGIPGAGSHVGTITVNGCSNVFGPCNHVAGSPKTITVTYNVVGLSSTPGRLAFFTTAGSNPSSKTITLALGGGAASWTSSTDQAWLSVSPVSGSLNSSSQTVTLNVNSAALPAGFYNATATFTAGSLTTSVAVTLTVSNPSVDFVSPYVVPAGVPADVIIRGHGFAGLVSNNLSVQFGSTTATASVVSDTEIHATVPASLTAGSYAISVGDGVTAIPSRSALKLVAIDPPAFAGTSITRSINAFSPSNLTYDAERKVLFLVDRQNNVIERYAFVSGTTWSATQASVGPGAPGGNPSIALSPDGTELIKTGPGTNLYRIDPASATLGLLSTVDAMPSLGSGNLNMVVFTNDGGAIGNAAVSNGISLYRYDMLTQTFTAVSSQFQMLNRQLFSSGNGDTVVMPSVDSSNSQLFTYDASDGTLAPRTAHTCSFDLAAVNRDATRFIIVGEAPCALAGTRVYDASFNPLGTLPRAPFVLSPDGAFAYAVSGGSVRKFDLNAPTSGGSFTEVGSAAVTLSPGGGLNEMTISPDGGTLFLAGSKDVIIMPAP